MSYSSSLGLNIPKLLPVAGTWAAPFTLYYVLLTSRIIARRTSSEVYLGDKDSSTKPTTSPITMETLVRCQANFLESVPLAFIFLAITELNGGSRRALNYIMAALFAFRVAHADLGLMLQGKFGDNGVGRPIGFLGSTGVLMGLAGYSAYLARGNFGL